MLCLCQILILLSKYHSGYWDWSDQEMFFPSSIVQFWWAYVNCYLGLPLLAERNGTVLLLLLRSYQLQPLTLTRHFHSGNCHWLDILSFFGPFLKTLEIPVWQQCHIQSHVNIVSSLSIIQVFIVIVHKGTDLLSCDWLILYMGNKRLNRCP